MTSSSRSDWRDKYLDALDENEQLQARFEEQQQLLRRALVRVSLAAEGQDATLDQYLEQLRGAVKTGGEIEASVDRLETALLSYEKQRESDESARIQALLEMSEALQQQAQDKTTQKHLKGFTKAVKKDEAGTATEQLKQLKWLQQQVFLGGDAPSVDKPGLFGRLFGRGDEGDASSEKTEPLDSQPKDEVQGSLSPDGGEQEQAVSDQTGFAEDEPAVEVSAENSRSQSADTGSDADSDTTSEVLEGQLQTRAEAEAADEKEAQLDRPVHEPAFSRVSDKVKRVLSDLLDNVEPAECTEQKAQDARERLERGLNWYELVPTLEDIRDLVLQAYLLADEEYREYLRQIHEVLETILSGLGISVTNHQQWLEAEVAFEENLSHQLGSMGRSVAVATEVSDLKRDIDQHLQTIQDALTQKQAARQQLNLGDQLAEMVEKVKQVEREAAEARQALEEQKQKALTDALTGLPNREAYNERAYHEWSRWKRYGHPLTLVVLDIDHFKRINDTYGHQAGDRVLQVLSKAVSQRLREVDFMARFGGEEFVILLPETEQGDGFDLMDKIRAVVASTPFRFKQDPVQVTLSMGVVGLRGEDTLEKAFARADKLLYAAKDAGRNRCMQDESS